MKPRSSKIALVILAVLLVASLAWNFTQLKQIKDLKDPQALAQQQVQKVIADVSKAMILPEGEIPTVATVSDLAPLKGQPFFANAVVGDQVLIYTTARKVILWRPGDHKIIEVAPLTVNLPSSQALPVTGASTGAANTGAKK